MKTEGTEKDAFYADLIRSKFTTSDSSNKYRDEFSFSNKYNNLVENANQDENTHYSKILSPGKSRFHTVPGT